ncbi:MAG: LysR substrate-binding domain-containing protein, partial [Pirellulaceae bacterium]
IDAGVSLLPAPTVDREVAAGALVARPLVGDELKRPIGIVQRRGKELGKTACRFMQLLLKQSLTSREIADLDEPAEQSSAALDSSADAARLHDHDRGAAAKPAAAAGRVAS